MIIQESALVAGKLRDGLPLTVEDMFMLATEARHGSILTDTTGREVDINILVGGLLEQFGALMRRVQQLEAHLR